MVAQRDINIILDNPIDWEYFRDKTVMITGATGRLGMYFAEALCKADLEWNLNMNIILLARSCEKLEKVFGSTLEFPNIYTCIQDVTEPILWDGEVDYIFHTAGMASPMDFTYTPVDTLWSHVAGTHQVMEFARKKKSKRIFYVSTVEIYGDWQSEKKIEESDMGPIDCNNSRSCYPESKRLCETMLAAYGAQYGIEYVGVRLCHTFGPGITLKDGRAFSEFLLNVVEGNDIVLQSDGSAMRTYTYVADAVGAMLLAFSKGRNKEYYNVAALDNLISIRDLAKLIAGLDPKQKVQVRYAQPEHGKLQYLPFHLAIMNVDKIKALGWEPRVNLEDAFRYTLESFLQRN